MLALDVNGAELLPSDTAGFGFDNNADGLSITPGADGSLHVCGHKDQSARLSRSPDNRPITQIYRVAASVRQDARMGEDMPFATHGGLAVRHAFPLDGEYVFTLLPETERRRHNLAASRKTNTRSSCEWIMR